LFAVDDVSRIRVYVNVPQVYSAAMRQGASATLSLPDYTGHLFTAHVIGNSGAIDSRSGTFQVQLVADNPDHLLKPGGYAEVRFDLPGGASSVHIPSSSLLFRAQGTQVAIVGPGDRIQLRSVTIGRDLGQTIEITSGLRATDHIVDNPPDSLENGELVRVGAPVHA
jgi:RND family efflux transporter MFP subunit